MRKLHSERKTMRKLLAALLLLPALALGSGISSPNTYNPAAVAITGGTINGVSINASAVTASSGTISSGTINSGVYGSLPVGAVFVFAGTTCPANSIAVGTSAGTLSRTAYPVLFTAIGTTWGAGDGSTTFGAPWLAADYAPVQAAANVGTTTVGQVIAHTHAEFVSLNPSGGTVGITGSVALSGQQASDLITGSTGGSANLAAGARFMFCLRAQ